MEEKINMGVFEIAPDITTEEMKAVFFDANALREPNYRLSQLNARGQRFYYLLGERGAVLYPSVTTILRKVMPENTHLTDWKLNLGREESEAYALERARFGTFVHGLLAELVVSRKLDLDGIKERLARYIEKEKLPLSFMEHEEEAKFALLSFAKWMHDYDVRPLAVEISLYHPELGFAGMLDLVCDMRTIPLSEVAKMREKKGDKWTEEDECACSARVRAIVDFKTTTKDFRDEHAIQLGLYKMMWDATFPDTPIDALANISPRAWWTTAKKAVSYQFDWQTDNEVLKQIPFLLELYKLLPKSVKSIPICTGVLDLDADVEENVVVLTLEELIERRTEKEDSPEENELFSEE